VPFVLPEVGEEDADLHDASGLSTDYEDEVQAEAKKRVGAAVPRPLSRVARRHHHRHRSRWRWTRHARKLLYIAVGLFVALLVFWTLRWMENRDLAPPPIML
jgi:hypothetical protein